MRASRKSVDGWEDVSLGSLCCLINGFPFKPDDWGPDGKPIIRIQNLNGGSDYNCFAGEIDPRYEVEAGTMLFAWSGNRGTSFGPYVWSGPIGLLNQHIFKVIPSAGIHSEWFFYALDEVKEKVERNAHGASGLVHVRKSDLVKYPIALPRSLPEQTKIAEILSTVDRAISQTEALIAKQQRVKTGLMQDLLTRGIDEHGNLRSEQTHQFKDSPLGRIPVEWEVDTFENITPSDAPIGYGIVQPGSYDYTGVRVAGIYTINSDFKKWHMSSTKIEQAYARSRIQEGDVLLSVKGTTGRVGVVPSGVDANISREVARIRPMEGINSYYLRFLMLSDFFQKYLGNAEVGTTRAEISIKILRDLYLMLPSLREQEAIVKRLTSIEQTPLAGEMILFKLRALKTALMQDLLTGRKRVTELLAETEAAA